MTNKCYKGNKSGSVLVMPLGKAVTEGFWLYSLLNSPEKRKTWSDSINA